MADRSVTSFQVSVPNEVLADLHERLDRTRWGDEPIGGGWNQGADMGYLRELIAYWRTGFDWREQERRLNLLPQFTTQVAGEKIHFVHVRGRGPNPLPLIVTHGWPSSFAEFARLIPLLTDPAGHGGDPRDSFDVIAPSLPGYGFSPASRTPGVTTTTIADLWAELMTQNLGYPKFCAHGGDIGAGVTNRLGLNHPGVLTGIHVMAVLPPYAGPDAPPLSPEELAYRPILETWEREEGGYSHLQRTRPQSLAAGLSDSPVGLAAWIVEKLRSWSDCGGHLESRFSKDELLTTLMIYWVTETIGSSLRLYYDGAHFTPPLTVESRITTPTAIALTTEKVNRVPQARARRTYSNIQHWTEFPSGGHFMAHEEPALLASDLRTFFRRFR